MARISRSAFLSGLGGLAAGVPLGLAGARYLPPRTPEVVDPDFPFTSFALAGEDLAAIEEVVKMPLLDINAVMREHFKVRPKIICVETLVSGTKTVIEEIPAFLTARDTRTAADCSSIRYSWTASF